MKKKLVFFGLIFPVILFSTIIPGGDVSGLWDLAGSPYYVDGEIAIQAGTELEIDPGVEVIFNDHYKFYIYGRITANGTANDSIIFKPLNSALGWHGLRFYNGNISSLSPNEISFCQFKRGYGIGTDNDQNGGAIFCSNTSNLTISNSFFFQNYCAWDGGAIHLATDSDVQIADCLFLQNDCGFFGGSIIAYNSDPVLNGCTFKENTSAVFAAGFSAWNNSNPELYNCIFIDNNAGACSGIYCVSSNLIMANILFINNATSYGSGAACGLTNCTSQISSVTAVDNASPLSGGVFWVNGGVLNLYNSILWNNLPENIYVPSGNANVFNSCISDGFTGTNITTADPLFIDYPNFDLHLSENSPCIDTGDESLVPFTLPLFDLDGNERILDGDLNGIAIIDMGVYEFVPATPTGFIAGTVTDTNGNFLQNAEITAGTYSTITEINGEYEMEVVAGNYTVSCYLEGYEIPNDIEVSVTVGDTSVADFVLTEEVEASDILDVQKLVLLGNFPNPFNPSTEIRFQMFQVSESAEIVIYNIRGQKMKTFSVFPSQSHTVTLNWNGTDQNNQPVSSGVYYYSIHSGVQTRTGRMLMLK